MSKSPVAKSPKKVRSPTPPPPTRRVAPFAAAAPHRVRCSPPSPAQEDAIWGRLTLSLNATETSTFELRGDKAQIVGRAAGSDVSIALPHISATHCTIREGERGPAPPSELPPAPRSPSA